MALFSRKKNTETKATAPVIETKASQSRPTAPTGIAHVLARPRITEKASDLQGRNVYVFDVAQRATKRDIMLACKSLYSVTPRKVAIVQVPTKYKRSMRTGKEGLKRGGKKAYVYLKAGETITTA